MATIAQQHGSKHVINFIIPEMVMIHTTPYTIDKTLTKYIKHINTSVQFTLYNAQYEQVFTINMNQFCNYNITTELIHILLHTSTVYI